MDHTVRFVKKLPYFVYQVFLSLCGTLRPVKQIDREYIKRPRLAPSVIKFFRIEQLKQMPGTAYDHIPVAFDGKAGGFGNGLAADGAGNIPCQHWLFCDD